MHWRNAWILLRKDLDEFKKQKLVIGSIVAMPIVLGVILPLITFLPIITLTPVGDSWDIEGLILIGDFQGPFHDPLINQTRENTSISTQLLTNTSLANTTINRCILTSCYIENSHLINTTVQESILTNSTLENVLLIHSQGTQLDGRNIQVVNSDVSFTKKKPSEILTVLPMLLSMVLMIFIIIPATLPTIIASYSIVGEKNNRTLEPLLATPTTDGELLAGKILSSFIPTMASTFLAFTLGVLLLNIVLTPYVGYPPLPTITWLLTIFLLSPTACLMSILACVLISSKVSDVRAAQQVGGFVVMPVVVLMLGVVSGLVLLSPLMIFVAAGIYLGIDLGLFYFARAVFNREGILVKWA
ncbi:MAG: ABC transporter permease subunit [Methanobacteriota archaeon]